MNVTHVASCCRCGREFLFKGELVDPDILCYQCLYTEVVELRELRKRVNSMKPVEIKKSNIAVRELESGVMMEIFVQLSLDGIGCLQLMKIGQN